MSTYYIGLVSFSLPFPLLSLLARRLRPRFVRRMAPEQGQPQAAAARPLPFAHARVAAPMVGASDLAFRLLCRRHGASLCYTEMFFADEFVASAAYRDAVFFSQLDATDRPLAVQFAANDPATLVAAARIVEPHCDLIDLNLGCPQTRAKEGGYGAYLLDRPCWPLGVPHRDVSSSKRTVHALTLPFCWRAPDVWTFRPQSSKWCAPSHPR